MPPLRRDVSPSRDFQKVANSITREAIPAGMFNGKAKQLYDTFYSLTRGAVVPAMTVRITKEELQKRSGIGSRVTLDGNIDRLAAKGLISYVRIGGMQGGNEYTVFLPEEVAPPSTPPSTPPTPPTPSSGGQFLEGVGPLETRPSSSGRIVDGTGTSGAHQTLIQDKYRSDDEAFAEMVAILKRFATELTGKEPTKADAGRWRELAEVIAAEGRIAAGRTTVSSVPAFVAEHLRRRLFKKDKAQLEAEVRTEPGPQTGQGIDASKCPDCFGTGMYYPQGFEKGVARCRHERLRGGADAGAAGEAEG